MSSVKVPSRHDRVYKDECMFSFDTPESPGGLFTSLTTWQSFGTDYVDADFERTNNPLYLKQVWKRVALPEDPKDDQGMENSPAPTKMAIGVEGGFDLDKKKFDKHITNYVVIFPERIEIQLPNDDLPTVVALATEAIITHDGFARAAQVAAAWVEEDRKESKYANNLPQLNNGKKVSPDPKTWRCEESGAIENLWLNLSTGYIGSGRKNWVGSGGTGAALTHFEQTARKYPLAVKLGTITPQGADVFSYAPDENDMVVDPYLAQHLAHWGINMQQQTKTEKTVTEMQIDYNSTYQFSRITESGSELVPLHGPRYVGLENLGNSCYMASVMQIIFSMPELEARYKDNASAIARTTLSDPGEDLLAMMSKLGVGLLSGRYTKPIPLYEKESEDSKQLTLSSKTLNDDYGNVRPFMFKNLIGKGHTEFSSARQQDATEFYQHFLEKIEKAEQQGLKRLHPEGGNPNDFVNTAALFGFEVEERIEDTQSGKVRYMTRLDNVLSLAIDTEAAINKEQYNQFEEQKKKKMKLGNGNESEPVQLQIPFESCLEAYGKPESIENFTSPETGAKGIALKRTRFKTFPEYLAVHLKRYYLAEDWTPRKLDVSVPMPNEIDLSAMKGTGPVDGEVLLLEGPGAPPPQAEEVVADPSIVKQLIGMGFMENGSKKAAIATNNASVEASMEWVLAHMGDPDFNDPPVSAAKAASSASQFPAETMSPLTAMGFTDRQAQAALQASNGNLEAAANWLFSNGEDLEAAVQQVEGQASSSESSSSAIKFIDGNPKYELLGFASHLGSNTSCGHYVAHIKKEGRFVLYNDEKVAVSQQPPTDLGFLYIYRRKN